MNRAMSASWRAKFLISWVVAGTRVAGRHGVSEFRLKGNGFAGLRGSLLPPTKIGTKITAGGGARLPIELSPGP